eukprot:scaffold7522_cov202-Skeletonema_marinoi.AAC.18
MCQFAAPLASKRWAGGGGGAEAGVKKRASLPLSLPSLPYTHFQRRNQYQKIRYPHDNTPPYIGITIPKSRPSRDGRIWCQFGGCAVFTSDERVKTLPQEIVVSVRMH